MTTTISPNSGFPVNDKLLAGGFKAGELVCFVAHSRLDESPKSGIMSHVIQQAILQGEPVLYINMESTIADTHF